MIKYLFVFSLLIFPPRLFSQTDINRSFYSDGRVESEIASINNILDGKSYWFYANGNLKKEANYSSGILNGWQREYYPDGIIQSEIRVNMGVKDGICKYYYKNGGLKETRTYENGKLKSVRKVSLDPGYVAPKTRYFTEISGIQNGMKRKEEYLCSVEICPEPVGGIDSVLKNLIYPDEAKKYGLEGTVSLVATIDEKGDVTDTKLIKGIGLGCDEAAEDAVRKSKFIPGQDKGKVVTSELTVYVPFSLHKKQRTKTEKLTIKKSNKSKSKVVKNKFNMTIENIICDSKECPYPIGGLDAIKSNIYFNPEYDAKNYSGNLKFMIKIDSTGKVLYTKIVDGIDKKIDENIEAGIINTKFNPGMLKGKPVKSVMYLTLKINK